MKIFIVCARLCHGGAERVAATLANGFEEKGHRVTLLTNLFEEKSYEIANDVNVVNLVNRDRNKLSKWLGALRIVRKHIKAERPNVVIGVMQLCSLVSRLAAIGTGVPVIMTEHDSFERPMSASMSKWEHISKFWIDRIYRSVTVLTRSDVDFIGKRLKNVHEMPNPLSIAPAMTVPEGKQHVLLAAGRVDNWHVKGFDVLIKAWAKALKMLPENDWMLEIAGVWLEEKSHSHLMSLAQELGCSDRTRFLGFRKDIKELYRQASVFVLSSRYEGFGLVLIEAMSQGCAPIACDYKGRQKEILGSEDNGIVCEPEDVDGLSNAICLVVKNDDLRHQMQQHALERSRYYSVENSVRRWECLITRVCDKTKV